MYSEESLHGYVSSVFLSGFRDFGLSSKVGSNPVWKKHYWRESTLCCSNDYRMEFRRFLPVRMEKIVCLCECQEVCVMCRIGSSDFGVVVKVGTCPDWNKSGGKQRTCCARWELCFMSG